MVRESFGALDARFDLWVCPVVTGVGVEPGARLVMVLDPLREWGDSRGDGLLRSPCSFWCGRQEERRESCCLLGRVRKLPPSDTAKSGVRLGTWYFGLA